MGTFFETYWHTKRGYTVVLSRSICNSRTLAESVTTLKIQQHSSVNFFWWWTSWHQWVVCSTTNLKKYPNLAECKEMKSPNLLFKLRMIALLSWYDKIHKPWNMYIVQVRNKWDTFFLYFLWEKIEVRNVLVFWTGPSLSNFVGSRTKLLYFFVVKERILLKDVHR